jgi:hypothetical protein
MKKVALLFVCAAVAAQALSAQRRDPRVIKAHRRAIPNSYIVTLSGDDDPEAVGLQTASLRHGQLRHVFRRAARGFSIRLTHADATALAQDPRVAAVEEDAEVHTSVLVETPAPWGLDRIDQRALPLNGAYRYVDTPSPVYVHVVDTGVRVSHVEFTGRAFDQGDFVGDGREGSDCNGHGTHVAATIAGLSTGVAKNATILSYRALDCTGTGMVSGVIAAIDAITQDGRRPAVANLSITGEASDALDEAVRQSIASGITYVVSAGNDAVDATTRSPARVAEAITVGAVDDTDTRASFSNFGPAIDLFAPGVAIESAWNSSDTATATLSGTSMAAPHVTGVIALLLGANASKTPLDAADSLIARSTPDKVIDAAGSPNRLLFSARAAIDSPIIRVTYPNGGEKLFTDTPYRIRWAAPSTLEFSRFDVQISSDNGATFTDVPGCSELPGTARSCRWFAPTPTTRYGIVKVDATIADGNQTSDVSDSRFRIVAGAASIAVTSPSDATDWPLGSIQQIEWAHNLGAVSDVRIELSRDGGVTFPETLSVMRNSTSVSGSFAWQVTGPATSDAVVRISWTGGPARDVSDAPVTISEP